MTTSFSSYFTSPGLTTTFLNGSASPLTVGMPVSIAADGTTVIPSASTSSTIGYITDFSTDQSTVSVATVGYSAPVPGYSIWLEPSQIGYTNYETTSGSTVRFSTNDSEWYTTTQNAPRITGGGTLRFDGTNDVIYGTTTAYSHYDEVLYYGCLPDPETPENFHNLEPAFFGSDLTWEESK